MEDGGETRLYELWLRLKEFLVAKQSALVEIGLSKEDLNDLITALDGLVQRNWRRGGRCEVYIDGASRGNPGPSGIGIVVRDSETGAERTFSEFLGEATNNVAEYTALIRGLEIAEELGYGEVAVCSDSELLVQQMLGRYKVKNPGLIPLWRRAKELMAKFARATIQHVPREQNMDADRLAVQAIDVGIATDPPSDRK